MKKISITLTFIMLMLGCSEPDYREEKKIVIRPLEKEIEEPKEERIIISLNIKTNFNFNKWDISTEEEERIDEFIEVVKNYKGKLTITGHTDTTGGNEYNKNLSLKRAESVYDYIKGKIQIENYDISIKGKGETEPLIETKDRDEARKNRRVEVSFEEAE